MATRSLTEVFILMRNNAVQNRHIFTEQNETDRTALVSTTDGVVSFSKSSLPPEWVDSVEEIQYDISRIQHKMKELAMVHDKHLNRPTLDDTMEEEHSIEIMTQEITQMFHRCQRSIQSVGAKSRRSTSQEQKVTKNIMSTLAGQLQDLSISFRKSQSNYLKRMKSREERSQHYFGGSNMMTSNNSAIMAAQDDLDDEEMIYDRGFTDVQVHMVDENSALIEEREKEITHIVQSISDLNEVFRDLATMVVEQGTILDQIDYNIEQSSDRLQSGLKQLQKAEKYQKKNRKMMVILILFVIIVVLIIILIAKKSS